MNTPFRALWITAAAALLVGCSSPRTLSPRGIVNPPGKAGVVATGLVLVPGVPFSTRQNLLLRSQDSSGRDYDLLAGPYPKLAGEAVIDAHNSITTAVLSGESFGYLSGYMPITRSRRVLAGSVGTIYAIRVSDSSQSDLIVVLDAESPMPVVCETLDPSTGAGLGVTRKVAKGFYVRVNMNEGSPTFDAVKPIPKVGDQDPDGVLPFLVYVTERAKFANLTTDAAVEAMVDLP